ncbi:MAG: hypothetical protein J6S92_07850, partial [Oscillospiraceae bacterium]|nr:hypothetical protein [Oscillospiraceae bacterium]
MRKHTIFAGCAALVTALCGHPAAYAASAPQEFAVFGDHSAFDPLNPYYIYGKALLNGTKKLPADGNYYFTGQIFIAGERCQEEIPVVPKAAYLYSETAKGYFVWREETPLSLSDAEKYCALHFANTIWKNNTGEVMGHPGTDPDIYQAVVQFAAAIGMVPLQLH